MTAANVFLGRGGGGEAIAMGNSRLYVGKQNFNERSSLITTNGDGGYPYRSSVAVSGVAYISADNGRIYSTVNFIDFTEVSISAIPSNNSQNTFAGGAYLFKVSASPNRIYALSYQLFGGDSNDAIAIWYSDNNCVNWTVLSSFIGSINASTQCLGLVDGGDGHFYLSMSYAGGKPSDLIKLRISDGAVISTTTAGGASSGLLVIPNHMIYVIGGNQYMSLGSFGTFNSSPSLPSNFTPYDGVNGTVSGSRRPCLIGRNNSTGYLQIVYGNSVDYSGITWTATTLPNIAITSLSRGSVSIASLGAERGFVAVYKDSSNGNNSGALYSSDGITWSIASENPSFVGVSTVFANPLAG